ncbi:MAG: hypothetical protein Q4B59_03530 [Lachnospiraceae bacterium]|nr:hypothetical protein [Lachnospiraceae bacterium]
MSGKELREFFEEHLVPSKLYKIGGHHKNRICLEQEKQGDWVVYFSDKKDRVGLMHFASEEEACSRMKDEVRKLMELMYGLTWAAVPIA